MFKTTKTFQKVLTTNVSVVFFQNEAHIIVDNVKLKIQIMFSGTNTNCNKKQECTKKCKNNVAAIKRNIFFPPSDV